MTPRERERRFWVEVSGHALLLVVILLVLLIGAAI